MNFHVQIWPSKFMNFHHQNDGFIQHFFKMLCFNVVDIHERPPPAMTLSTGSISHLYRKCHFMVHCGGLIAFYKNPFPLPQTSACTPQAFGPAIWL